MYRNFLFSANIDATELTEQWEITTPEIKNVENTWLQEAKIC